MKDTAFDLKDRPDLEARLASMHSWDSKHGKDTFTTCAHPRGCVRPLVQPLTATL